MTEVDRSVMVMRGLWAMSHEREVRITRVDGSGVTGRIRLFLNDVPAAGPSSGAAPAHSTVRFVLTNGETIRINDVEEIRAT